MITIIIGALVGFLIAMANHQKQRDNIYYPDDYVSSLMGGSIFGFIIGLMIAIALPAETYDKQCSLNIETLQDNNGVGGGFFLGSGNIDGTMCYVFYYEENGFYKMMKLNHELVKIKYSDGNPRLQIMQKGITKSLINYFALDLWLKDKTYIIEVPKGTIKNNYILDAQ